MDTKRPKSVRLVASRVASLGPGTFTDPGQRGLQLRVTQAAHGITRSWLLRFKFKGAESRILLGHFPALSLEQARRRAQELRDRAAEGIDPRRAVSRRKAPETPLSTSAAVAGDQHSIDFLVGEFTERHLKHRLRRPEYAVNALARDVLPEWSGRDARTIRPREVIELLDRIVDRGSRVMANRIAGLVGQLFKFGIHRGIVDTTPVQLLYRPGGTERARSRVLSDTELQTFLADPQACTRFERLEHVVLLLLLTGQRRGELAQARWRDIDFKARTWRIPPEHSKTGRGHVVPLSPWAVREFRALKAEAEGSRFVLPDRPGGEVAANAKHLTRSLARCQPRFATKKIASFTLHDLRRTCRTGLARLKVEPHIAERVLNHAQPGVVDTYDVHDHLDEKRGALEKWAKHLAGLAP